MSVTTIYTLLLTTDKYYVGKTTQDPQVRFQQHLSEQGAKWTVKYKPLKIIDTYESECPFAEDKTTKDYMITFGIENVRGGSYCSIDLPDWQIQALEHEFKSIKNECYKCKKTDHYAKVCEQYYLDLEKQKENKYLDKFTSIDTVQCHLNKVNSYIKDIGELNVNITSTNINTAIIPEEIHISRRRGGPGTIHDPSTYKPITVKQIEQVIDYFDELIEDKKLTRKFRDIFNINDDDLDPFLIIAQNRQYITSIVNQQNNPSKLISLKSIKEGFLTRLDSNTDFRLSINSLIKQIYYLPLNKKYTWKDKNYNELLKELVYIKELLIQRKYKLFNEL